MVSDVGGNRETLGESGCYFPLNDSAAFHDALIPLLQSTTLRVSRGTQARARAPLFDIARTVEGYLAVYQQ